MTASHYDEETNFLVASKEQSASEDDKTVPVNLLTAAVPIQYIVNDFESWTYKHSEPAKLLNQSATVRLFAICKRRHY